MFSRSNVSTVCAMWTSPSRRSWISPNTEMGLIESAVAARAVTTSRRVGLYRSSAVPLARDIRSFFLAIGCAGFGPPVDNDVHLGNLTVLNFDKVIAGNSIGDA